MVERSKRPRRQKVGDRLITPNATDLEVACDHAVAPFDRVARQIEATWGIDRLPELVSPETAAKYGSAIAKLNAALGAEDREAVAARAGVCIRGLQAMDKEARAAGHTPMPEGFWMYQNEGKTFIVSRNVGDWPLIQEMHPGVPIYSMHEVAVAISKLSETVVAIKEHFPKSQIKEIRNKEELDDAIPF